jgi:hypothetical protein
MAAPELQSDEPIAGDGAAMAHILEEAGVTRERPVRVTGRAGLTAVFWLCQNGYAHAAYVHPKWIAKMPAAAALLIPHPCRPNELIALLHGAARSEGQLLIVQACSEPPGRDETGVAATLASLGYRVEGHISDGARQVYIARSRGLPRLSRAA